MQESGETYLETILILKKELGAVRSVDVASRLGYSKPSVSRAMGLLREERYITMEHGEILLTETGLEKASRIYERHVLITEFLIDTLNVPYSIAAEDACRIEHMISETCFRRIKARYMSESDAPSPGD